jgi:hypothetical protein
MFPKSSWQWAVIVFSSVGLCQVASAQLYSSPSINDVQSSRTTTPTISNYTSMLATQRLNAGYGSVRSPTLSNLPGVAANPATRLGLGLGSSSRGSKPFTGYSSQPTVSPYLNLFRTDLNGGGNFNYSTLVQPQLQQQQVNQQLERQTVQNNRRLQAIAAQADFSPQGSKDEYPTGHQTVFNYMGHYFPAAQVKQKRTPGR